MHGRWETVKEDQPCIKWARDFHRELAEDATGGVYVNFMTEEETERVPSVYGPGWERLREVKRRYDPSNLFSMNQNIAP